MVQVTALPPHVEQCIENCQDCHRICEETIAHCLEVGGQYVQSHQIRLLMDCAQICQTANEFLTRMSRFSPQVCSVCAQVCTICASECERFDDDLMRCCAEVCRRCAESCTEMASQRSF